MGRKLLMILLQIALVFSNNMQLNEINFHRIKILNDTDLILNHAIYDSKFKCAKTCAKDNICFGFTYDNQHRSCYLIETEIDCDITVQSDGYFIAYNKSLDINGNDCNISDDD